MNITMLIPYWGSQLCGGMIGAVLAKAVVPSERYLGTKGGAPGSIAGDGQIPGALVGEVVMTTTLLLVVCMGGVNGRTRTPLVPLHIGFVVTAAILAGGGVSGACMNPARAFGPAVVANYWDYHWVYWVGPMVAALLSGALVRPGGDPHRQAERCSLIQRRLKPWSCLKGENARIFTAPGAGQGDAGPRGGQHRVSRVQAAAHSGRKMMQTAPPEGDKLHEDVTRTVVMATPQRKERGKKKKKKAKPNTEQSRCFLLRGTGSGCWWELGAAPRGCGAQGEWGCSRTGPHLSLPRGS
ncbi:aquaporin-8 isoform X1 [Heliangelus exortis]|uniref:aquaporin-8 isoform X1 n=1 Tax=Heliangelus exortis TaxID=472823 RepID=UPI003A958F90